MLRSLVGLYLILCTFISKQFQGSDMTDFEWS